MHRKEFKLSILTLAGMILGILGFGTIMFSLLEGWPVIDSFYFVTMTATTVGYGDFVPTHRLSKIITVIYALSIVPFVLYTFSIVAKYQTERVYRRIHGLERKQREQEKEIDENQRRIAMEKRKLKQQEEELEEQEEEIVKTERRLLQQVRLNKEQEEDIKEHEKMLTLQRRKLALESKLSKEHDEEIAKELKKVETLMKKKAA